MSVGVGVGVGAWSHLLHFEVDGVFCGIKAAVVFAAVVLQSDHHFVVAEDATFDLINVCMCVCVCVYVSVCACVHVYTSKAKYVCVYVSEYVCVHI